MSSSFNSLSPPLEEERRSRGARGESIKSPLLSLIIVSGALSAPGTSSAGATRLWESPYVHDAGSTTSSLAWSLDAADTASTAAVTEPRQAVTEVRRRSGLTWEQLAALFGVSRRSVHFWASGKPVSAANQEHVCRVLDLLRAADRGDVASNRAALLERSSGPSPLELLSARRYEEAAARLGPGRGGARRPAPVELDPAARAERRPPPPEELVDAMHDRIHRDTGRGRGARTVTKKPRERDG